MDRSADFADVMERYSDTVWRVCAVYLRQKADIEDAFQDTFVKYASAKVVFASEEHRKAWLIRVAANICKDQLKSSAGKTDPVESFDDVQQPLNVSPDESIQPGTSQDGDDVLEALRKLPEKYRSVLYLTYYEGYPATEIAQMLDVPVNTVYTNLARGRKAMKEVLQDER